MDDKEKIINLILESFKESPEFFSYITLDEIRQRLDMNVDYVKPIIDIGGAEAMYRYIDKSIRYLPKYNLNNLDTKTKTIMVHECLHALSTKIYKRDNENLEAISGIHYIKENRIISKNCLSEVMFYESGRGLNEGITQWFTRKLTSTLPPSVLVGTILGIQGLKDDNYPLEQAFVEELAILYGEENIIKAYLNNDISFIVDEISKNSLISKPEMKFDDLKERLDVLNEICSSGSVGKELKNSFLENQQFFIDEFLDKEIELAMKSGDKAKINDIGEKLQKLLELDIKIGRKGNIFRETAEEFNGKCNEMGISSSVEIKNESVIDKMMRSFNTAKNLFDELSQMWGEHKKNKNHQKLMLEAANNISVNKQKNVVTKNKSDKLLEDIRGVSEDKYKDECEKAANDWLNRRDSSNLEKNTEQSMER